MKYYVNAASTAPNPDGSSWAKAYKDLQSAVDAAAAAGGGEVWVAQGTYTSNSDPVLTMKKNVALYGGFVGNESLLEARNWESRVTVIDGEGQRRCVIGADNARLDGFTIARGNTAKHYGGGMYNFEASPSVTNCIFTENTAKHYGGGMDNVEASPTVTNCIFTENTAYYGGGMYNFQASPTVTNCTFAGNKADYGGGMRNLYSSPTVTNCTFAGNKADYGDGMRNLYSSPTVTNCTFSENTAEYSGGGMRNDENEPLVIARDGEQLDLVTRRNDRKAGYIGWRIHWDGDAPEVYFLAETCSQQYSEECGAPTYGAQAWRIERGKVTHEAWFECVTDPKKAVKELLECDVYVVPVDPDSLRVVESANNACCFLVY